MKFTLKAPGYERWKLKCDDLLSNFAFNFNLRRYTEEAVEAAAAPEAAAVAGQAEEQVVAEGVAPLPSRRLAIGAALGWPPAPR